VSFRSILFDGAESTVAPVDQEPAYFADLNLSQVAESITASREEYDLNPFFYTRLTTPEAITYRHEVLRDLEGDELAAHIASFAQKMRQMREHLTRAERTTTKASNKPGSSMRSASTATLSGSSPVTWPTRRCARTGSRRSATTWPTSSTRGVHDASRRRQEGLRGVVRSAVLPAHQGQPGHAQSL